jgi:hypothetical protein
MRRLAVAMAGQPLRFQNLADAGRNRRRDWENHFLALHQSDGKGFESPGNENRAIGNGKAYITLEVPGEKTLCTRSGDAALANLDA